LRKLVKFGAPHVRKTILKARTEGHGRNCIRAHLSENNEEYNPEAEAQRACPPRSVWFDRNREQFQRHRAHQNLNTIRDDQ
jgi:hypothetical protein